MTSLPDFRERVSAAVQVMLRPTRENKLRMLPPAGTLQLAHQNSLFCVITTLAQDFGTRAGTQDQIDLPLSLEDIRQSRELPFSLRKYLTAPSEGGVFEDKWTDPSLWLTSSGGPSELEGKPGVRFGVGINMDSIPCRILGDLSVSINGILSDYPNHLGMAKVDFSLGPELLAYQTQDPAYETLRPRYRHLKGQMQDTSTPLQIGRDLVGFAIEMLRKG